MSYHHVRCTQCALLKCTSPDRDSSSKKVQTSKIFLRFFRPYNFSFFNSVIQFFMVSSGVVEKQVLEFLCTHNWSLNWPGLSIKMSNSSVYYTSESLELLSGYFPENPLAEPFHNAWDHMLSRYSKFQVATFGSLLVHEVWLIKQSTASRQKNMNNQSINQPINRLAHSYHRPSMSCT